MPSVTKAANGAKSARDIGRAGGLLPPQRSTSYDEELNAKRAAELRQAMPPARDQTVLEHHRENVERQIAMARGLRSLVSDFADRITGANETDRGVSTSDDASGASGTVYQLGYAISTLGAELELLGHEVERLRKV